MSTICKLALTAPSAQVTAAVEEFLRQRAFQFDMTETEWPAASNREAFNMGDDFPSVLSVKQVTPDVTEIHFNSFGTVEDLASNLSATMRTNVVVNIYQSVSTASYWAFHANGQLVRSVEAGDGEVSSHAGEPLPFENEEPGRADGDQGDRFFLFDHQEQDWYNREVGVPVEVYEEYEPGWVNFRLASHLYEPRHQDSKEKPWWRFW